MRFICQLQGGEKNHRPNINLAKQLVVMTHTKMAVTNTQAWTKHIRKLSICQAFSVCRLLSNLIWSEAIPHLSFYSAHFSLSFPRRLPDQRQATLMIKTLEMANHYLRKQLSFSIHADERMCHVFEVHQGSPCGPCGQLVVKSRQSSCPFDRVQGTLMVTRWWYLLTAVSTVDWSSWKLRTHSHNSVDPSWDALVIFLSSFLISLR